MGFCELTNYSIVSFIVAPDDERLKNRSNVLSMMWGGRHEGCGD